MDAIREQIESMQMPSARFARLRLREMENAYGVAIGSVVLTGAIGVALSLVVAYLLRRVTIIRAREEWLASRAD